MSNRLQVLLRWGRRQLKPWMGLSLATIELIANPHKPRHKLHASLAKVDLLPIVESFHEFLDDLPLWFY